MAVGLLTAVACGVLLVGLDSGSMANSDDVLYAGMAREMVRTGDWLNPSYQGHEVFEKPPLLFWSAALGLSVFGEGDLGVRLPGVLGAVLLLALFFVLIVGPGKSGGVTGGVAAWFFLVLLLGSVFFVYNSRRCMTDSLFWAFVLWSFWFLAVREGLKSRIAAGVFLGLAGLTKGVALAPVVVVLLIWACLSRKWGRTAVLKGTKEWLAVVLVAVATAGWWFVLQVVQHGQEFVAVQLGYHVLNRMGGGLYVETSPWLYFGTILSWDGILYLILILVGLSLIIVKASKTRDKLDVLLALFSVVYLMFIILMGTRLEHYFYPMVVLGFYGWFMWWPELEKWVAEVRGWGQRTTWLGMAVLSLAVLVWRTAEVEPHLRAGNYGPFALKVADQVSGDNNKIVAVDMYEVGLGWYTGLREEMWITEDKLCKIIASTDMLVRSNSVWCGNEDELMARLMEERPVIVGDLDRHPWWRKGQWAKEYGGEVKVIGETEIVEPRKVRSQKSEFRSMGGTGVDVMNTGEILSDWERQDGVGEKGTGSRIRTREKGDRGSQKSEVRSRK